MSEVYLHLLFSGRRKPSRDGCSVSARIWRTPYRRPQRLQEQATFAQLYPRAIRETIISYGLEHWMTLEEINDRVFVENEKTLC